MKEKEARGQNGTKEHRGQCCLAAERKMKGKEAMRRKEKRKRNE